MPDQDCEIIREQLSDHPSSKVGFVIFRCAYKDDSEWARFMEHLNTRTRQILEESGDGDLFEQIDWDVQEDRQLEDADSSTVREHFQHWRQKDATQSFRGDPRRTTCIAVSQVHVDLALKDMELENPQMDESAWVELVSIHEEEGYTSVKVSYIFPRVYALVLALGWDGVDVGEDSVFEN